MKKIIILSLLLMIVIPKPSYSQDNPISSSALWALSQSLWKNSEQLSDIKKAIKEMKRPTEAEEMDRLMLYHYIEKTELICFYESQLLAALIHIKEERKLSACEFRKEAIRTSKHHLLNSLEALQLGRSGTIYGPMIDYIDQTKQLLRSSLQLLDRATGLL